MNRSFETSIGEGIGALLGAILRAAFELLFLFVLPALATATITLVLLHADLTGRLIVAVGIRDSLLTRLAVGTATFLAGLGAASAVVTLLYIVATSGIALAVKIVIALVVAGIILSLLGFARDRLLGESELDLDFSSLWE